MRAREFQQPPSVEVTFMRERERESEWEGEGGRESEGEKEGGVAWARGVVGARGGVNV